ncbi:DUF2637 domain-containing protein [Streptomyces niveus]|uniref:DUF2637 domain-containing protein n=1 Tax=Streptomyces niveus TaxID=193462 RepID=UPI000AD90A62|nr:DUF2637 domain-containing protein [Streptomyces niveus]
MRHHQGTAADPPGSATEPEEKKGIPELTRVHYWLIGIVALGAVVIASIGFAGSYNAVRKLAVEKGFGTFAYWFPIGIDAGIVVLLGLDLLLTWLRIPFPLLRQTAWLLTGATIAFNAAAAWPDPLGVGMHAVIPVLFVVSVEAARHAVGRIADITADKHMEGVRITRWLLSPVPTFRLWRRMKLWEVRSYEKAVSLEQARLIYQSRLQARFGRGWRRKAPVEALMPLRLAKYGVPIFETAAAGLAAAGIPLPAELERLDHKAVDGDVREQLPAPTPGRELERGEVDTDQHDGQDEADEVERQETAAGHPEPYAAPVPQQAAPAPYEAFGPEPAAAYSGGYEPQGQLAAANGPWAARNDGRPAMVQARIDGADWLQKPPEPEPFASEPDEVVQSPIGDYAEPVPAPEPEPVPEVVDEAVDEGLDEDEDGADEGPEPEPDLTGVELLEYRYVRLPAEQRYPNQSASSLARSLSPGTGFTEGTARKYLKPIIDKHS